MKYALLSDVHANLEALTSVLRALESSQVDRLVCLGDIVGYHANPNECIALLKAAGAVCIAGNHDRAAAGQKDTLRFGATARRAITWTRSRLTDANRAWLRALPSTRLVVDAGGARQTFFCVHAALHPEPNDDLHLSSDARVAKSFEQLVTGRFGAKLCFFGHTHRTMLHEYTAAGPAGSAPAERKLQASSYYLINPGSVGQPRDQNPEAAFVTFDTRLDLVEFHRAAYDVRSCLAKAERAGLLRPPGLTSRSADWLYDKLDTGRTVAGRVSRVVRGHAR